MVRLNKNFSSTSIFRNFPFFSGILFLSFLTVLFLRNSFLFSEYLFLGELFPWFVSSYLTEFKRFFPLFSGLLLLDGLLVCFFTLYFIIQIITVITFLLHSSLPFFVGYMLVCFSVKKTQRFFRLFLLCF